MRKSVIYLLFIFNIVFSHSVCATTQTGDTLLYKTEGLILQEDPLESFFNEQHPRPDFEKLSSCICSAEWKGYHGVWMIKDGYLQLLKLQAPCAATEDEPDIFFSAIFPNDKPPLKATWVNGTIHAIQKQKTIELRFENGKLVNEQIKNFPSAQDRF
jgi:hypothetical protein